jgi:hypothetical protein
MASFRSVETILVCMVIQSNFSQGQTRRNMAAQLFRLPTRVQTHAPPRIEFFEQRGIARVAAR